VAGHRLDRLFLARAKESTGRIGGVVVLAVLNWAQRIR
jgi:hypothetical protein